MQKIMTINGKDIYNEYTTILYTSSYNYNNDLRDLLNQNCDIITKDKNSNIKDIPLNILKEFNCMDLLDKKKLTKIDEIKLNIISSIVSDKNTIIFFNVLTYLDNNLKEKVIKKLKEQDKTIINYTTEIEETLYLDYLIVIHQNKIIMEGKTKEVLLEEKILKKLGFNLPFIVELSKNLKYYNIVNKEYFDIESLVDDLWK